MAISDLEHREIPPRQANHYSILMIYLSGQTMAELPPSPSPDLRPPSPVPDLRTVGIGEIYGELRRRNVNAYEVREELGLHDEPLRQPSDPSTRLKFIALGILGIIAVGLIVVIALLSIENKMVSSVITGLAGSAIGAVAGILAGSATSGPATGQNQQSPPTGK